MCYIGIAASKRLNLHVLTLRKYQVVLTVRSQSPRGTYMPAWEVLQEENSECVLS